MNTFAVITALTLVLNMRNGILNLICIIGVVGVVFIIGGVVLGVIMAFLTALYLFFFHVIFEGTAFPQFVEDARRR